MLWLLRRQQGGVAENALVFQQNRRKELRCLFFSRIIAAALIMPTLSGCSSNQEESRTLFLMDTVMTLSAFGENAPAALDISAEEIIRLDGLFSVTSAQSEVYTINQNSGGALSADAPAVIRRALYTWNISGGAFDSTICLLVRDWGFYPDDNRVPQQDVLDERLPFVDGGDLVLNDNTRICGIEGMEIDLGGIAKGYAANHVIEILRENGVKSAIISHGGNLAYHIRGGSADSFACPSAGNKAGGFQILSPYSPFIRWHTAFPADFLRLRSAPL
jgi:thiamine biosynthesis lipoprotein ApbE